MFRASEIYYRLRRTSLFALVVCIVLINACGSSEEPLPVEPNDMMDDEDTTSTTPPANEFDLLLVNQIDSIIIPASENYQVQMTAFLSAVNAFNGSTTQENLDAVRDGFSNAYLAYQRIALHDYFETANTLLVFRSNQFPVDEALLETFIANQSFDFTSTNQIRATGFPALDFMLYGPEDGLGYFTEDENRLSFLVALVNFLSSEASDLLVDWNDFRDVFIINAGTAQGSSISTQLNASILYWEENVREAKVGFPIGLSGPFDSPGDVNPELIEAVNRAAFDGNESFTLSLAQASVEELQRLYTGGNGQGYDDLLATRDQAVDDLIDDQFELILSELSSRNTILGDTELSGSPRDAELFDAVQAMVTLFKGDIFALLNVQDEDMMNDGD
ncbi:MAG: imelysin family protein [Bacteroidota bacterium]